MSDFYNDDPEVIASAARLLEEWRLRTNAEFDAAEAKRPAPMEDDGR